MTSLMTERKIMTIETVNVGLKQDNGAIDWQYSFAPADMPQINTTYLSRDDFDETESIRRCWRWKGCQKWRDDFFDALYDYGDLQRKRVKWATTKKHPCKSDDKFGVLKKAINHV